MSCPFSRGDEALPPLSFSDPFDSFSLCWPISIFTTVLVASVGIYSSKKLLSEVREPEFGCLRTKEPSSSFRCFNGDNSWFSERVVLPPPLEILIGACTIFIPIGSCRDVDGLMVFWDIDI